MVSNFSLSQVCNRFIHNTILRYNIDFLFTQCLIIKVHPDEDPIKTKSPYQFKTPFYYPLTIRTASARHYLITLVSTHSRFSSKPRQKCCNRWKEKGTSTSRWNIRSTHGRAPTPRCDRGPSCHTLYAPSSRLTRYIRNSDLLRRPGKLHNIAAARRGVTYIFGSVCAFFHFFFCFSSSSIVNSFCFYVFLIHNEPASLSGALARARFFLRKCAYNFHRRNAARARAVVSPRARRLFGYNKSSLRACVCLQYGLKISRPYAASFSEMYISGRDSYTMRCLLVM